MSRFDIVGLCGSQRAASLNWMALRLAGELMPFGMVLDPIGFDEVPPFDGDLLDRGFPSSVVALRERLRRADGVLIATPEFNFSIPGMLKNALDWLSRGEDQPFAMKPVAIISASPGPLGGARVQYELRKVLLCMNAHVLAKPEVFIGGAAAKFDAEGRCIDNATRRFVGAQMQSLEAWIGAVGRMNEFSLSHSLSVQHEN